MSEEINNNTAAGQTEPAAEKIDASETAAKVAQLDLDSDEDVDLDINISGDETSGSDVYDVGRLYSEKSENDSQDYDIDEDADDDISDDIDFSGLTDMLSIQDEEEKEDDDFGYLDLLSDDSIDSIYGDDSDE